MTLIETPRTVLRDMTADDAPFILDLLNQPTFLRYIGDRQVRTMHDSVQFIETRYRQSYRDHGYGLYIVQLRATSQPIGMCGFVKRAGLPCADMGFAFLPAFEGHGYASESAIAALQFGRDTLGLRDLLAIAQPDNVRSHRLLHRPHRRSPLLRFFQRVGRPCDRFMIRAVVPMQCQAQCPVRSAQTLPKQNP